MTVERDPFGREHRSGRLSDEETADRMLSAAIHKVNDEGLPISFDLLRFEELIVHAGVARSAVYRRWPTKHHFYADLLRDLARRSHPAMTVYEENTIAKAIRLAEENLHRLATPEGRRWLAVELCRLGAFENFASLAASRTWGVYVTLSATLASLPAEGGLQADLQDAMHRSGEGFFTQMAGFYGVMLDFLGFRTRADLPGVSTETIAELGAAIIEGLTLNNISNVEVAKQRFTLDPFGVGQVAQWTLPGIGYATLVLSLIEPDPGVGGEWDETEISERAGLLRWVAEQFATSGDNHEPIRT